MKEITFARPEENFNKNCPYAIYLGNSKLFELKNGEERTVQIDSGSEETAFRARIQWCGSEPLDLNKALQAGRVKVSGNKFLNRKLPILGAIFPVTGVAIFNNLNLLSKSAGVTIMCLFILGLIWTLTFGRNKWLKMEI